jgi:agmatine deiminase
MKTQAQTLQSLQKPIPAEWAPQSVLWTAWPSHADLWLENLEPARGEIAQMIKAAAKGQKIKVLAMGDEGVSSAKKMLGNAAEVVPAKFGDIWVRDTGPIFTAAGLALRFKTNGWGGKYDLEFDDTVGDELANAANANIIHHDFILEGGALEHNGESAILTTRQCVLNENRNDWSEAEAEKALKSAFGASKIYWLDDGLMNDHTDGHIDNLARFIGPNTVLTQHAAGPSDPNADLFEKTQADLKVMGFEVKTIPSPGLVTNEDGDIIPASHMNFIITNATVIVPTYGTDTADEAVVAIAKLFPTRSVIGVSSIATLSGGGSFHCITQQEPQK